MLIKLSRHHIAEVFVQRSCWRSSKVITSCFPFLYRQNQLPVYFVFSSFPREVSFERKLALSTGYYWIIWFSCQKLASARQHSRWMKSMHSGHVWMASWKLACARQCIQAVDFVSLGPGSLPGPGSHPNKPSLQYWGLLLLIRKQLPKLADDDCLAAMDLLQALHVEHLVRSSSSLCLIKLGFMCYLFLCCSLD